MPTYLITGACGFIGSNYVHHVVGQGAGNRVVALDNLGFASNEANLDPVRASIEFELADITDAAAIESVYRRHAPDFVVNFAAESHNDRAINDPSVFMRTNALGAQTMLESSRRHGVAHHVHISTIEVYGELPEGQGAFTERSPLNAKTPYSAAKAAGDQIVRAYMQTYPELRASMTHCANNYGPYQFPEKLIPLMITNVLTGRKVPVYGDGLQRRDWIHVSDHSRAVDAVLHSPRREVPAEAATDPGLLPIYDISARHEVTNIEIVDQVLALLGRDPADWVEHVADRPNHDRRYLIDPSKIEAELGWAPLADFETALAETVTWYVEHPDWWGDILARTGSLQIDWAKPV